MTKRDPTTKAFDFVAHEDVIDKEIARSFSASFMSDTKWRKTFAVLDDVDAERIADREMQVIWKFVGSPNDGVRYKLPSLDAMHDRFLDSRFWFGPMYYKEIEWLEFPKIGIPYRREQIPGAHFEQDIEKVRIALQAIGKFQIEESALGIKLYGHKA
ncbi:MAG: hypothetical protein HON53_11310 [Planctomycetaceae bacterium]|jgi:hypothetical protein|nr:hypothetical protein [Planctomycetaceae bacterium]MBT6153421.1 hypothetical protein [Planctomycetaceae bacterium]MBT6485019.1 hypothetical protein [Planctomycetaceae bacterium]MBT6497495.1 hypothetical protein [Planctomycetaceae bacterium]